MSPSSQKSDTGHAMPERLLELLSARYDGELSAAEAAELEGLCAGEPGEVGEILGGFDRIRRGLQGQRRTPLAADVFSVPTRTMDVLPKRERRGVGRRLVPALVGILALSLLIGWGLQGIQLTAPKSSGTLVAVLEGQPTRDAERVLAAPAAAADLQRALPSPVAGLSSMAESSRFLSDAADRGGEAMVSAMAPMSRQSESGRDLRESGNAEAEEVRTVADVTDWKVVVVKVGRHDRTQIVEKVGEVLQRYGLQLESSVKEGDAAWMGVVLTSVADTQQHVIQDVEAAVGTAPVEWNPAEVLSSTREQIIEAVRQSLRSPTESEILSGEVYVAVSTVRGGRDVAQSAEVVEASERMKSAAGQVAAAGGKAGLGGAADDRATVWTQSEAKSAPLDRSGRTAEQATLVVFEFEVAEEPGRGDLGRRNIL